MTGAAAQLGALVDGEHRYGFVTDDAPPRIVALPPRDHGERLQEETPVSAQRSDEERPTMGATDGGHLEELSYDDCLARLRAAAVGRIAVVVDEAPILLPVNFRLVEDSGRTWLVLRTRPGNVIDRGALMVAFEVDEIDSSSHEGWSVVVRGTLGHLDPEAAGFRERFDPDSWLGGRESWLVVEPFAVTGRRLVAADHGWAFDDRGYL